MADKKLTDVDIVQSADDSDSLILIKGGVARAVKQIAISSLNLSGGTGGTVIAVELRKEGNKVQWRAKIEVGSFSNWKDLFLLDDVKGEPGDPGDPGKNGISPVISIGTVETVENNIPAAVTKTGSDENPVFNFKIPKGKNGTGSGDVTTEMLNAAIKTNVTDKNFLQQSQAESTYLKITDANSKYQTISGMSSYVTNSALNGKGYITQSTADSKYMAQSQASNFLTTSQASNTYVTKESVPFKFIKLSQSEYDRLSSKDNNTVYMIVG